MKMKRLALGICVVAIVVVLGFILIESQHLDKAKTAAMDYVIAKYDFDVECVGGEYSWIDPSQYYIRFQTKGKEEISFTVIVGRDLTVQAEERIAYGNCYSADNYLKKKFAQELERYIKKILGEDTDLEKVLIRFDEPGIYAFSIPVGIDSTSSLDEVLHKMDILNIALYYNGLDKSLGKEKLENVVKTLDAKGVSARWITAYDINGPQKMAEIERE